MIGFDNHRHIYGDEKYPGELVLQDVMTLHGRQFKDADLIVASPPCQAYSYRAMPWKRAKALPPPDNSLFEACFRIQNQAIAASGRYIPLIVENVRGAQKWVGRAPWNFGSFYLWGDVPALMPITRGRNNSGRKNSGGSWFAVAHNTTSGHGQNPVNGIKVPGMDWSKFGQPGYKAQGFNVEAARRARADSFGWSKESSMRTGNSKSDSRRRASAQIAKIPEPLARHIAQVFKGGPA